MPAMKQSEDFSFDDVLNAMIDEFGDYDEEFPEGSFHWYLVPVEGGRIPSSKKLSVYTDSGLELSQPIWDAGGTFVAVSKIGKSGGGGISLGISCNDIAKWVKVPDILVMLKDYGFSYDKKSPIYFAYKMKQKLIDMSSPESIVADYRDLWDSYSESFVRDATDLIAEIEQSL